MDTMDTMDELDYPESFHDFWFLMLNGKVIQIYDNAEEAYAAQDKRQNWHPGANFTVEKHNY